MIHNIGPINVCTDFEINRYQIDEFRKHAHTSYVTQKPYVVRHGGYDTSDRYFDHFKQLLKPVQKLWLKLTEIWSALSDTGISGNPDWPM